MSSDVKLFRYACIPDANVWLTVGKVHSGLHYDDKYNSLTVLSGKKRVFLFPPSESQKLYPAVLGQ